MKLISYICILSFFTLGSLLAADPIAKPQRISDDSKIIGYALIKEPNNFYAKLVKLANIIYPGSGATLDQQAATIKPILDSSVSISAILYSNENFQSTPFVGIYITVKDKKVFENPMVNLMPIHEVVDNTLVISTDPNGLAKFKEFQKNIIALKAQKDIEVFIDIKNIVKLNDNVIAEKAPYTKDIYSQVEMASIKIDLSDAGIEYSASLISTDKSNLQVMLTQPAIDSPSLLKLTGPGNFSTGIANFDFSKAKGFLQDIIKMAYLVPEINEDQKKLIKEFEPLALDFCNSELISTASSVNFKDTIKSKYILKVKDPAQFINRIKTLYTKLGSDGIKGIMDKTEIKDMYEFKWEEVEKYNGAQIYKIGTVSKKQVEEINKIVTMPMDQYLAADATYCYSASDIASLKELIENVKSNPKTEIPLESFSFFKAGSNGYLDFQLMGYIKLFENMVRPLGINLDTLLALKLPPLKVVVKMDGNFTIKSFMETSTISALVQRAIEIYSQAMSQPQDMGGDDNPKSQP